MAGPEGVNPKLQLATRVVHGSGFHDERSGAVVPPLAMAATFDHANSLGLAYGRQHNPTWTLLERAVADLESAQGCVSFASGMAGVAAVLDLAVGGGKVVLAEDAYSGTRELLRHLEGRGLLEVELVDATNHEAVARAAVGATIVWLETIGNPLLTIPDLARAAAAAHAQRGRLVVDNTFATPLLCRPLELGADVVLHSASKYIGGHDDLVLGVVAANDQELLEQLRYHRTNGGGCPGQLEAWLALRGLRTLDVRLRRQAESAAWLAPQLTGLPGVRRVYYPGLAEPSQRQLAERQLGGHFGAMISLELEATAAATERVCAATRIWTNATSLGSVESLLERRARWPGEGHLPEGLVRLSVGVEDPKDLLADLKQALGALDE